MIIDGLAFEDSEDAQLYFEELAIAMAQELIAEAMDEKKIKKADLARVLGKTKSYLTGILSSGRNLTVRTLARVLFSLGYSADFAKASLKGGETKPSLGRNQQPLFQEWGETSLAWAAKGPPNHRLAAESLPLMA